MTRQEALALIWRETHRDYKGTMDGKQTVLVLRSGGTTLVPLDDLTEDEIADRVKGYPRTSAGVARMIASHGITEFVPANSRFIPEKRNEGRYVGVTLTGWTCATFSQEEVEASGLPMTEE